jgi:hypothetical protein
MKSADWCSPQAYFVLANAVLYGRFDVELPLRTGPRKFSIKQRSEDVVWVQPTEGIQFPCGEFSIKEFKVYMLQLQYEKQKH